MPSHQLQGRPYLKWHARRRRPCRLHAVIRPPIRRDCLRDRRHVLSQSGSLSSIAVHVGTGHSLALGPHPAHRRTFVCLTPDLGRRQVSPERPGARPYPPGRPHRSESAARRCRPAARCAGRSTGDGYLTLVGAVRVSGRRSVSARKRAAVPHRARRHRRGGQLGLGGRSEADTDGAGRQTSPASRHGAPSGSCHRSAASGHSGWGRACRPGRRGRRWSKRDDLSLRAARRIARCARVVWVPERRDAPAQLRH